MVDLSSILLTVSVPVLSAACAYLKYLSDMK